MNNRKTAPKKSTAKSAAKKPIAKKPAAKATPKSAPKKAAKPVAKAAAKPAAKKTVGKKIAAKKPVAKKIVAKKTVAKKPVVKAAAKKTVAPKAAPKKAAPKKVVAKKAAPVKAMPAKAAPAKTGVRFVAKKSTRKVASARPVEKKKVIIPEVLEAPTIEVHVPPEAEVATTEALPDSVNAAARVLFRLRAEKVQLLDLRGQSDVADFFLLGTCSSEAQMQAILNNLQREFKTLHLENLGVEYRAGVRWAVFDGIDVMVHLFEENARNEYSLERLWRDGKQIELKSESFVEAKTGESSDDELV